VSPTTPSQPGPRALISITDPDAVVSRTTDTVWIGAGIPSSPLERLQAEADPVEAGSQLCRRFRDGILIRIGLDGSRAVAITGWRGIVATRTIYYAIRDDGTIIASDHYRNVVAALPLEDRHPSDTQVIEHYLCRTVFDRATYSRKIARLGHGDRVSLAPQSGSVRVDIFDHIEPNIDATSPSDQVATIGRAIAAAADAHAGSSAAVMFSGGVDSTLLMTYVQQGTVPVTMVPDSPEFAPETGYARAAAQLLHTDFEPVPTRETDYLSMLERAIDVAATPPIHYATAPFTAIYDQPHHTYIMGEGADSVFGLGMRLTRLAGYATPRPLLAMARLLGGTPGTPGMRMRQLHQRAARLVEPPDSLAGFTAPSLAFGDLSRMPDIADQEAIEAVFRSHLDYVLARVRPAALPEERFDLHVELSHWRWTWANTAPLHRQLAQGMGKRSVTPYLSWPAIEPLLRLPVRQRYIRRFRSKWIPKALLTGRLPGYDVTKKKQWTGLPMERFCRTGPLAEVWDRYPVPDIIPRSLAKTLLSAPTAITWNAITHAIWTERIARNRDLQPHPAAITFDWSVR